MKTYFRVNTPSDENKAIKDLLNNKEVGWSSDSKYEIGDYILVYVSQKSGQKPRITLIAEVMSFKSLKKDMMNVKLKLNLDESIEKLLDKQSIEDNGFPPTQYNSKSYKINTNEKLLTYINKIFRKKNIKINLGDYIKPQNKGIKPMTNNKPLNQVLYGPPGTGKTYNTINKALEIIFEKEENTKHIIHSFQDNEIDITVLELKNILKQVNQNTKERKSLKTAFDYYSKQIEFVTFHQSYGYEEFVEGIKADLDSDEIKYILEEGIFKRLCNEAQKTTAKSITIDSMNQVLTKEIFRDLYNNFTTTLIDKDLNQKSNCTLQTKTGSEFDLFKNSSPSIVVKSGNDRTPQSVSYNELEQVLFEKKNPTYSSYENIIIEEILKSTNYKEETVDNQTKNHILIIDEINRGNISKIFGELITLIEPSKRIGEGEEIMLKLPNSSEPFGVPSNLYIIGTMNTADRSIAQIDTALRRRFEFVEMMPKPELLKDIVIKDTNIEVVEMLTAINERIEYIYDREHMIGHSYFMSLIKTSTKEKLDEIFRVNIIPLLAEYFYGDWNDIKIILNDTKDKGEFITKRKESIYQITDKKSDNHIYSVNKNTPELDGFSISGYKNIYAKREVEGNKSNNGD